MRNVNNKNRGISILGILFFSFIIILILSYFNVNLKSVVESEDAKENFSYVGENSKSFWDKYFKGPATYLWNDVWVDIFWKGFILNMERIRDGQPTDLDNAGNNLKVPYQNFMKSPWTAEKIKISYRVVPLWKEIDYS